MVNCLMTYWKYIREAVILWLIQLFEAWSLCKVSHSILKNITHEPRIIIWANLVWPASNVDSPIQRGLHIKLDINWLSAFRDIWKCCWTYGTKTELFLYYKKNQNKGTLSIWGVFFFILVIALFSRRGGPSPSHTLQTTIFINKTNV